MGNKLNKYRQVSQAPNPPRRNSEVYETARLAAQAKTDAAIRELPEKTARQALVSQEQDARKELHALYQAGLFKKPVSPTNPSSVFVNVERPAEEEKAGEATASATSYCAMM